VEYRKGEMMLRIIKVRELYDNFDWDKVCEIKGLNPWCVNEGLIDMDDELDFDDEEYSKLNE